MGFKMPWGYVLSDQSQHSQPAVVIPEDFMNHMPTLHNGVIYHS